jgi:hypothetical protein
MTTSSEYRQFARECTNWASEASTHEIRDSFLDLACDWTFAALAVGRVETNRGNAKSKLPVYSIQTSEDQARILRGYRDDECPDSRRMS